MKVVGLTGGIGAGKSTVAAIFKTLHIPVYDSDMRAKALYTESKELRQKMIAHFGSEIYLKNQINRKLLAEIVFSKPSELTTLNGLVHPLLHKDFEQWKSEQTALYVVREAAILIESGGHQTCDQVIVVTAPIEVREKRVMLRDEVKKENVRSRMRNQMSEDERLSFADFVVVNDGKTSIIEQVLVFHSAHLKK